jgi:hypothetical protein
MWQLVRPDSPEREALRVVVAALQRGVAWIRPPALREGMNEIAMMSPTRTNAIANPVLATYF